MDNPLMESQIGLYKTELIKRPPQALARPRRHRTRHRGRVDWFNNQRLHTAVGGIPPHEHETNYYAHHQPQPAAGVNA
ncbi:integrase core domain-containing protein [Streptomyces violaceorubidus]